MKESVYIILMTNRGERWLDPDFGSDIMRYTFMDTSLTMLNLMASDLRTLLLEQEGYSPQRVDSRIHTTSEGSIEITELNLWMPASDKSRGSAIRQILAQQAGLEQVTIEWG